MTLFKKTICCLALLLSYARPFQAQTLSPLPWNWAKNHYSTGDDRCMQVICDPVSGGIYSLGKFNSYNFQIGGISLSNNTLPGTQQSAYYIAKHDPAGNVLWAHSSPTELSSLICGGLDAQGNLYLVAQYWGTLSVGSVSLSASPGNIESCIIKYSPSGNPIWIKATGTDNSQTYTYISGITEWDNGHLAISGMSVNDTLGNFHITSTTNTMVSWNGAPWVAKMDTAGNFTQLVVLCDTISTGNVQVKRIAVDQQKNLYIAGIHMGNPINTPVWQLGIGTASIITERTYIAKFDSNLSFLWSKSHFASSCIPAAIHMGASGLALDPQGHPFFLGVFSADSLAFDASHGHNLSAAWATPHPSGEFLLKYNPNGTIVWDSLFKSAAMGMICADQVGNVYCAGAMSVPFGVSFNGMTATASGNSNIFVVKIGPDGKAIWLQKTTLSGSQGYLSMDEDKRGNVYIGGRFQLGNAGFGTTTLTLTPPAPSYPYDGDAFIARLGNCNVTAPQLSPNTPQHLCHNATLVVSASISPPLQYNWSTGATTSSITVSSAGNYFVSAVDSTGCYASSAPLQVTTGSANSTVSVSGSTLTSVAAASYQWLDCSHAYQPVSGAVMQNFTPGQSGSYAVIITQNGCADTSACYSVTVTNLTSVAELQKRSAAFLILPNPGNGEFTVETNEPVELSIADALGNKILKKQIPAGIKTPLSLLDIPPGIYIAVAISETGSRQTVKIVKE